MNDDPFDPPVGVAQPLGPGVRRVLAPNASPMTYRGTNTYLLGAREIAVIDPGPDHAAHLEAILGALETGQRITHIFVTHSHVDHAPLARRLSAVTGAPVLAFGPSGSGRSEIMTQLAATGLSDAGEGIDPDFAPDQVLEDGETITGPDWHLTAIWTPGHLGNHLSFAWNDVVFTGDLVMGWASSLVSPPDGDLTDFMTSCRRLRARGASVFHAGHGAPIEDPMARLDWLIEHRLSREAAILKCLSAGAATTSELAAAIYTDTPTPLIPAAKRNILAHLVDLYGKSLVAPMGPLTEAARFEKT
ncbi:MAG: MBL fold metallo-hydrolase [Pseudomonadota bacterium]